MAPFSCGDLRESPKFWLNIPSPKRVWRLFQLRLTRLFGTGLAEPNWWDPAQSGVPLVVFSSSWRPMNHEGWMKHRHRCEVWLMTTFRCFTQNDGLWKSCFPMNIYDFIYEDLQQFPESKRQVPRSSGHTCLVCAIWHWWSELDQAPNRCVQRDWRRQMNPMLYYTTST